MPFDILIGLTIGMSVIFFWMGRRFAGAPVEAGDQLERYLDADSDPGASLAARRNLSQLSFGERVLGPLWRGLLARLGALAPQRNVDVLARRLETAGRPSGLNVLNFLGLKSIVGLLMAVAGFVLGTFLLRRPIVVGLLFTLAFAIIGFYVPDFWLGSVTARRKREIVRALPDALDMIVVCVEAGQSFDQALKRVSTRWANALTEEFNRILAEMLLGRSRREALSAASDRIQLHDMSNLIMAILQADQLGVSVGSVLRTQADQLRILRRQRAEELAREAAIKLLFPLVFLIFPAMFAVLLGPAVPLLLATLGGMT